MADDILYYNNSGTEASTSSIESSASTPRNLSDNQNPPKNLKGKKRTKKQPVKMSQEQEKNCINSAAWAMAPEFVPRHNATNASNDHATSRIIMPRIGTRDMSNRGLCPHEQRDGLCRYPAGECAYPHGDLCDLCRRPALHPFNADQRRQHMQTCIRQHEADMELSFAVARSNEMVCGVCFEIVMQKALGERRFGILPNCNHCFCLACIRRWRSSRQFENKIIRACPECRVTSDFVCPSSFWVDTKEAKQRAIQDYLRILAGKDCKYFRGGRGCCPFGNKCFYRHCMRDGTQVDVGPPPSLRNANNANEAAGGPVTPPPRRDQNTLLQGFQMLNMMQEIWYRERPGMVPDYDLLYLLEDEEDDFYTLERLGIIDPL